MEGVGVGVRLPPVGVTFRENIGEGRHSSSNGASKLLRDTVWKVVGPDLGNVCAAVAPKSTGALGNTTPIWTAELLATPAAGGMAEDTATLAAAEVVLPTLPAATPALQPSPSAALLEEMPGFDVTDPPAAMAAGGVTEPPTEPRTTLLLFDSVWPNSTGCDRVASRVSAGPSSKREQTDCTICSKFRTRPMSSKRCLSCSSSRSSIILALLSGTVCSLECLTTFSIARPLALRVEVACANSSTSSMNAAKPSLSFEAAAGSAEPAGAAKEPLCMKSADACGRAPNPGLGPPSRWRGVVEPDIASTMGHQQ